MLNTGTLDQKSDKGNNDKTNSPVEEIKEDINKVTSYKEELEEDLNSEYIDKRSIEILPIHAYSFYRKANMKNFGQKKETIGSCVRSSKALSSDKEEVEKYFPNIIGLSPSNPDFINRVKQYLNNIQVIVTDKVILNITFIFNHKKDYLKFKNDEDKINDKYDRCDKSSLSKLKDALEEKIESINTLETLKSRVGRPQNFQEYIIWRHCLLYKDIAKDNAIINSDPSIRFYIRDEAKEKDKQSKQLRERITAKQNFVEMLGNDKMFNAMVIQYAVNQGISVQDIMFKDRIEKEFILDKFSVEESDKFNKLFSDKHLALKSFIETLIARGELNRSEFNQNISSANGDFIGANMNEAIVYFNNPQNADIRKAYENKLKFI